MTPEQRLDRLERHIVERIDCLAGEVLRLSSQWNDLVRKVTECQTFCAALYEMRARVRAQEVPEEPDTVPDVNSSTKA